jgi:dienelactone hydrolase
MRVGRRSLVFFWLLFALLALPFSARAADDDLIENKEYFTVTIGGRLVRLEGMTVKRADVSGRLPVALITHGKLPTVSRMLEQHASNLSAQARDLAERGWLAVVVMRRGFGASDGPMPAPITCQSKSMLEFFESDADDLEATLAVVSQRPDADPSRMIAIGASAGGVAVTALAARNPKGLAAVVNISGGLRFDTCNKDDSLIAAMRTFGKTSRVPSLWVYAKNDRLFDPDIAYRMHSAFLGAGADVKLVMLGSLGRDGHTIFDTPIGRDQWLPEMDAFLRYQHLPTWPLKSADTVLKKLISHDKYADFIETYISAPGAKALAQSQGSGALGRSFGFTSMDAARKSALDLCQQDAKGEACAVVMENNVWVGPGAEPAIASGANVNTAERPQTASGD